MPPHVWGQAHESLTSFTENVLLWLHKWLPAEEKIKEFQASRGNLPLGQVSTPDPGQSRLSL